MSKKLLRKEVYDKIWESSVKETAEKYNVDYADLLKVCHKANIPIPSPQYRLALNNKKDITKLKVDLPMSKSKYIVVKTEKTNTKFDIDKEALDIDVLEQRFNFLEDPVKEQKIAKALIKASRRKNWQTTSEIKAYKENVKRWREESHPQHQYNNYYYSEAEEEKAPMFIDNLSPKGMKRATRLLNKIVTILKQAGEQVNDDLTIIIGKDKIEYEIREDQDKVPHKLTSQERKELANYEREKEEDRWAFRPKIRKYDHPYNGHLRIRFIVSGSHKHYLKDDKQKTLEEQLPAIIATFYETYLETKQKREEYEAQERERKEKEEQEKQREQKIASEKKQVATLINTAKDYQLANVIRTYVKALEKNSNDIDGKKIEWMQSVANWIDPLISEENPYLEKRQHGESDKKKEEYLGEVDESKNSFDNYLNFL